MGAGKTEPDNGEERNAASGRSVATDGSPPAGIPVGHGIPGPLDTDGLGPAPGRAAVRPKALPPETPRIPSAPATRA